ncbi:hypothetical protein CAPTEDRAFT_208825 [Capitella teleta]|uniref:Uncharacterized protein n=1 Tax=Capitella teleta TaxID=283909 RepID=R7UGK1_CAPTE|nr:hypothetical protein CAPTEDRAFT_208825 [Capitella teleta]|eukprot:ELU02402.1 hypothetical protein CAPTEDRAFT_208825 [Capitella teleta]
MLFPVDTEELPPPPVVNLQAPHELHWRKNPPEWVGSIQAAYHDKYTRLADQTCCLQCGAVPCPVDHDADERTRLRDMDFVRNLVDTKRRMEEKMKKMEQDLSQCSEMSRRWTEERKSMEYELKQLRILHERNTEELKSCRNGVKEQAKFKAQIYRLQAEFDKARKERDTLQATVAAQSSEIDRLKGVNIRVTLERDAAEKTVKVFKVQIVESKKKVIKLEKSLSACETEKREAQNCVKVLTTQLAALTQEMRTKKQDHQGAVEEFRESIRVLEEKLVSSENRNRDLETDITGYLAEIESLKTKLAGDKRFFQFVAVKREVNVLKDENISLQHKLKDNNCFTPLPVMKKSGKITVAGSRVNSADIRQTIGKSIDIVGRCSSAQIRPSPPLVDKLIR